MAGDAASTAELSLLGGFDLVVGESRVQMPPVAQRLLALLALRGVPMTRSQVCGALWPHAGTDKANASLRSTLWRTQRACGRTVIVAMGVDLALAPGVRVDLPKAVQQAHRLLEHTDRCDDLLNPQTKALLALPLLPGWYGDDWVVIEREFHDQLRLNALEDLSVRMMAAGQYSAAVEAALAVIHVEPLRESAHDKLIQAHLFAGNRWNALRQYQQYRHMLGAELGLEPSPALTERVRLACHRTALPRQGRASGKRGIARAAGTRS